VQHSTEHNQSYWRIYFVKSIFPPIRADSAQSSKPLLEADKALIDAAKNGDLAGVQAELDKGVDVNAKAFNGWTPLHHAAQTGYKEIIELLIAKGADVNARDMYGSTPLHNAVYKEVVELLIAKGADVGAKVVTGRNQGKIPLDLAIWRKKTKSLTSSANTAARRMKN